MSCPWPVPAINTFDVEQNIFVQDVCSSCYNEVLVIKLVCQHSICSPCALNTARAAISDPSRLPLRCCRVPISLATIQALVTPEIFLLLRRETERAHNDGRIRCPVLTCSAVIASSEISASGSADAFCCPSCRADICMLCWTVHDGLGCGLLAGIEDENDTALERLARQSGWKRCPACTRMISRDIGCSHITCVCRAHFCYDCGLELSACACAPAALRLLALPLRACADTAEPGAGLDLWDRFLAMEAPLAARTQDARERFDQAIGRADAGDGNGWGGLGGRAGWPDIRVRWACPARPAPVVRLRCLAWDLGEGRDDESDGSPRGGWVEEAVRRRIRELEVERRDLAWGGGAGGHGPRCAARRAAGRRRGERPSLFSAGSPTRGVRQTTPRGPRRPPPGRPSSGPS